MGGIQKFGGLGSAPESLQRTYAPSYQLGDHMADEEGGQPVRLAGFDNTPAAQLIGLTSAVFDCERLAENALLLMLKLVADEASDSSKVLIPVTVHKGKTT